MTHADMTRSLKRPPGVPESKCDGEVMIFGGEFDSAQPHEGAIGERVMVWLNQCDKCDATLIERCGPNGAYLANTIEGSFPTPFGLLPPEERRRIFAEQDAKLA